MMKFKLSFFLLFQASILAYGQTNSNVEPICRVYGKVQGVYYDGFLKACYSVSSEAACKDLADELAKSMGIASAKRNDYDNANYESCRILHTAYEDGIEFILTATGKSITVLRELYWKLLGTPGVEIYQYEGK